MYVNTYQKNVVLCEIIPAESLSSLAGKKTQTLHGAVVGYGS